MEHQGSECTLKCKAIGHGEAKPQIQLLPCEFFVLVRQGMDDLKEVKDMLFHCRI